MALNPIPAKVQGALSQQHAASASEKQLLCNAFIKQIPVEWRCSQCEWRYSLTLESSSVDYAEAPPDDLVEAFKLHSCWSVQGR